MNTDIQFNILIEFIKEFINTPQSSCNIESIFSYMKYSEHFNIDELSINIRIDNSLKIKSNNSNIFNFETDEEKKKKKENHLKIENKQLKYANYLKKMNDEIKKFVDN